MIKIWDASRICVSSLHRGHPNLCIIPILVYVLLKRALYKDSKTALKRHLKALASSFYDALHIHSDNPGWHGQMLRPSGENESRCSPQQEQHYFCVCLCTGVCKTLFEKVSVDRKRNLKTTNLSKHSSDVTFTFPLTGQSTFALSPEAVHNFGHLLTIRFQLMRNKLLSPTPSIRWSWFTSQDHAEQI